MSKSIKGEWVKYEEEAGKWFYEGDTSYKRLCRDLEPHKQTGWSLDRLCDNIYGEFIDCHGTPSGDIYVYYTVNEKTGLKKPKLLLITHLCDDKKMYVSAWGTIRKNGRVKTYAPKAKYLGIILEKFNEINAKDWVIEETTEALQEYEALVKLAKGGIKTSSDIITIYRNFTRTDTNLARRLVKGRNVRADYEVLDENQKVEFVKVLSCMKLQNLEDLESLTINAETIADLCVVNNVSVLRNAVAEKGLICLKFAPIEYRTSKSVMLEMLKDFDIRWQYILGIDYIGKELLTDIDILRALTRTQPFELRSIFEELTRQGKDYNELLIEKLKDRKYVLQVLDMHFRNCISNPSYVKERFLPADVLWYIDIDMLDGVDDEILYGPFATPEEEQMKSKTGEVIKLVRKEIKDFKS